MSELGGPTTQSGILYQNTIAAISLGQMCFKDIYPPEKQIVAVRCEAPTSVDDIVLTYADNHNEFIQAKEALKPNGPIWNDLWQDFLHQFRQPSFQLKHDKIVLHVGENRHEWRDVQSIIDRAVGSGSPSEWKERLTKDQTTLLTRIETNLTSENLGAEEQHALVSHLQVRQAEFEDLELRVYRDLPPCNVLPLTLFCLLRDLVSEHARYRKRIERDELIAALKTKHGILFDPPAFTVPQKKSLLSFAPQDHSRLQWFVSSRLKDGCLRLEREAAIEAIAETQWITPWACENDMPAGKHNYEECCLHFAAESDGLVLILEDDMSPLCKREFNAADAANKSCYIFIKEGNPLNSHTKQFVDDQRQSGYNPIRFRNLTELKSLLGKSLQAKCVQAFRHSQHLAVSTDVAQARMQ